MTDNNHREIITKKQAIERGLKRYYTGIPCARGHVCVCSIYTRCLDCMRMYARNSYAKNKKEKCERIKKWQRENQDKVKQYYKKRDKQKEKIHHKISRDKLYAKYPERYLQYMRNAKAKRKLCKGKHTINDIRFLLKKQNNRCAECKCKIAHKPKKGEVKLHVDHIMPLKLGGSNDVKNLQCLCRLCNQVKGGLHPAEWAKKKGRLL